MREHLSIKVVHMGEQHISVAGPFCRKPTVHLSQGCINLTFVGHCIMIAIDSIKHVVQTLRDKFAKVFAFRTDVNIF